MKPIGGAGKWLDCAAFWRGLDNFLFDFLADGDYVCGRGFALCNILLPCRSDVLLGRFLRSSYPDFGSRSDIVRAERPFVKMVVRVTPSRNKSMRGK